MSSAEPTLLPMGTTIPRAARDVKQAHSWYPGDATTHVVRCGPNYKKNGKKAPSSPALYESIGVEFLAHDSCVVDVGSRLQLPALSDDPEPGLDGGPLPRIFVVNFSLPTESAAFLSPPRDGRTVSLVLIFRVTSEAQRAARDLGSASPAVRLLARYCAEAPRQRALQERFKVIGVVNNMADLGLPGMIQGYNGKPMLCTKSGTLIVRDGFLEMDVNVHYFGYAARKGLYEMKGRIQEMVFSIAVVVQAETEDEMPEQLWGCTGLRLPKLMEAPELAALQDRAR